MSKDDDLKYMQSVLNGKNDSIEVTDDYNRLDFLAEKSFMFIFKEKDSLSSGNPSEDEIGLYAKLGGRIYKVSLSEVTI
tara:strand:- start:814 stop:1050 length:237 start_codon:yes stop_codon:yes gene_type:complete